MAGNIGGSYILPGAYEPREALRAAHKLLILWIHFSLTLMDFKLARVSAEWMLAHIKHVHVYVSIPR